uniref:Uncharacterized protein n=1 Tax=Salix viminalis TaxID=40686 RepID=A0A6N2M852_SALVM
MVIIEPTNYYNQFPVTSLIDLKPNNQSNPYRGRQKNHQNSISTLQQHSLTKQKKTQKQKERSTALAIASLAALSSVIFLITSSSSFKHYRRRRRRQQQKQSSSCYLQSHQKPQLSFKRVLIDNSFSQFKHLNLHAPNSSNLHPYEAEIKNLIENPESFEDLYSDHQKMSDFFSYVWIETEAQLKSHRFLRSIRSSIASALFSVSLL